MRVWSKEHGGQMGKLTALQVQRAKRRGYYGDGGGLWLAVHANGSRSWVLRYGPQGRRYHGLGPLELVTLAQAREKAREARRQLLDGIDPIAAKRARKAAVVRAMTFQQCAEGYFEAHQAGWKSEHAGDWRRSVDSYALP